MKRPAKTHSNGVQRALQVDFVGHRAVDQAVGQLLVASLDVVHLHHAPNEQLNHQRRGVVGVVLANLRLYLDVLCFDPGLQLGNAVLDRLVAAVEHVVVVEEVEVKEKAEHNMKKKKDSWIYQCFS